VVLSTYVGMSPSCRSPVVDVPDGSNIMTKIIPPGQKKARLVKVVRRDVQPTSVDAEKRGDDGQPIMPQAKLLETTP